MRVLFHDRKGRLDFAEAAICQRVCLGYIGLDVAEGTLGVRDNGSDERAVPTIGKGDGPLAVRVGLEGRN